MVKSVGLYGLAMLAQRLGSVVLIPFTTRYLTTADYGILDLIEQISTVLSVFIGSNFASALGYFYNAEQDERGREGVMGTILACTLMSGIAGGAIAFLLSPVLSQTILGTQQLTPYMKFMAVFFPMFGLLEALLTWLRIQDRAATYVRVSVIRLILVICCTLAAFIWLHLGLWGVMGSNMVGFTVFAAVLTVFYFRAHRFRFHSQLVMPMLRYSFPLGLSFVATFILLVGDRFIIPHYVPLSQLGIYSAACKFGTMVGVVHSMFSVYYNSQIFKIVKLPDARAIFARLFTYMLTAVCFAGVLFIASADAVVRVATGPAFHSASTLVPLIVLAFIFRAIADHFRALFAANNQTRMDAAVNWVSSGVCLAAYFVLIPRFGILGAAWATLIAFAFSAGITAIWARRVWHYELDWLRIRKIALVFCVIGGLGFVHWASLTVSILWSLALVISFPAVLFGVGFLSSAELEQARRLIAAVRARIA